MWGVAFSFSPSGWRIGRCDAIEDDGQVIGVWYCLGPIAITCDYE